MHIVALAQGEEVTEKAEAVAHALPGYALVLIRVGIVVAVAVLLTFVLRRVVQRLLGRIQDAGPSAAIERKRARTLTAVVCTAVTATIWAVAVLVGLDQAGIDTGPFLAAAGVGGIAIGFGAQHLVRDVIAGFFVILEDQFHVGDVVRIGGVSGMVEKITLRTTILRDLNGERHVVPNGQIAVSTNLTKGFSRYLLDLPVPFDADIDRVVEIVRGLTEDMRRDPAYSASFLKPLEVLGVEDYGPSEVILRMYVETMPGKQWDVGRELRRRVLVALDEAGISLPYPHREVIVRTGQSGNGDR